MNCLVVLCENFVRNELIIFKVKFVIWLLLLDFKQEKETLFLSVFS